MGRLLILLALLVVVVLWIGHRMSRRRVEAQSRKPRAPAAGDAVQDMVACAHCGLHLPRTDAVLEGDRAYCGDPHRRLGPRGPRA